jgi:hypothetical protein
MGPLIDFKNTSKPVKEQISIDELKLGSPEVEITNDVIQRLVFLLEIKPATDY